MLFQLLQYFLVKRWPAPLKLEWQKQPVLGGC
jgi:hypothetical protein